MFTPVHQKLSNFLPLFLLLICQCTAQKKDLEPIPFPSAYSLEQMEKVNLSDELEEISGLEWIDSETLWAIEDESSIIYQLDPMSGKRKKKFKFAKNKDIEDILFIDGTAWVLRSNGNLYEVENPFSEYSQTTIHEFPIHDKRDFESLIKPEGKDAIWIFCKVCSWDENASQASVYEFDLLSKTFKEDAVIQIKNESLTELVSKEDAQKVKIQPSAIAFHPIEKKYYLLSSSDHWLMKLDENFNPVEFFHLPRDIFKQPEGISFADDGTLFISNEARNGKPNFLIFPFNP